MIFSHTWTLQATLMDVLEFAINHESQWELQLSISEILDHHNQRWPMNLHFRFLLLTYLLREFTMLWRFYINVKNCIGIIGYWSEPIFITSLKKNIALAKLFKTSFCSNILTSFIDISIKALFDPPRFIWVQTF